MIRHRAWFRLLTSLVAAVCGIFIHAAASQACEVRQAEAPAGQGTLPYLTAGPTNGEVVLLLHGLFAQKEQWQEVLCALADAGYQPVAPDLPGYGQSRGYGLDVYPLESQANLLHEFSRSSGLQPQHVAGNSMGGAIAALYTHSADAPAVRTLAFIGGTLGIGPWAEPVRTIILSGNNPFIPQTPEALDAELAMLLAKPPSLTPEVKQTILNPYQKDSTHFVQVWNIVNLYGRVLAESPGDALPTLILWGAKDHVFDIASSKALAKKYPHHVQKTLPDTGHLPMIDNPEAVSAGYIAFLKRQH